MSNYFNSSFQHRVVKMMSIVEKIQQLFDARNVNKKAFANFVGIDRTSVYNLKEESIKWETIIKAAEFFDIPLPEFLFGKQTFGASEPLEPYGNKKFIKDKENKYLKERIRDLERMTNILERESKTVTSNNEILQNIINSYMGKKKARS